jgi:hypothetical protein
MPKKNVLIWLGTLVWVMACLPTVAGPNPDPTTDPGAVNTFIVQTANAASTQTAAALPTATITATFTRTPRATETASPTATNTFVFILPGLGTPGTAAFTGINSGNSNSEYGCEVREVDPINSTVITPRQDFIATWLVKNIGRNDWFRATMDYVYEGGDKLHKVESYSIPKGVEPGKNVFLPVDMEAPKNKGTYTTRWALVVDNHYFCPMTLTIVVK